MSLFCAMLCHLKAGGTTNLFERGPCPSFTEPNFGSKQTAQTADPMDNAFGYYFASVCFGVRGMVSSSYKA